MSKPCSYITTPIYYVNDKPHIGHVYTTTICDVFARFMRFADHDVFFLTGTDEHGVRIERVARERGIEPQELADENAAEFRSLISLFGFTNNDFIRTTEERHTKQVQALVQRLVDAGHVYLGEFEGWYDEGQEEYIPENKAKELGFKSPINQKPLVRAKENNYYFKLSSFQKKLEKHFAKHPEFVRPEARRNEVLGRLREGLQDVPVSRTNFTWGVSMQNDPQHVIYVWIDALFNYITALGLGNPGHEIHVDRGKYWPATYHVIGKEILWFHAVIWPAVLMALDIPLPKCVYAHSFWIREGQKMSKSLGNFIDLPTIQRYIDTFGLDAWRYYLCTQGPLGANDADFADQHFREVYHADLVNTVGNCASRVTAMIGKYFNNHVPGEVVHGQRKTIAEHDWPAITHKSVTTVIKCMEELDYSRAIGEAMSLIRRVDGFINLTEPFKLAKESDKQEELGAILYQCLEAIRIASILLWPVIPQKMSELWQALNLEIDPESGELEELTSWGKLHAGNMIKKVALYPRIDEAITAGA